MVWALILISVRFVLFLDCSSDSFEVTSELPSLSICFLIPNIGQKLPNHDFNNIFGFSLVWFGFGFGFNPNPECPG